MTMPRNPHVITGDKVTARTTPRPARKHAKLTERLAYGGRQPYEMPEQMVGALAVLQGMMGDASAELRKLNDSPVLFAGMVALDATGIWSHNFDVQMVSATIANLSSGLVIVAPGGAGDATRPPTVGAGVHQIGIGVAATVNIMGNSITVYGPPGAAVDVTCVSRYLPAAYGSAGPGSSTSFVPKLIATSAVAPVLLSAANTAKQSVLVLNADPTISMSIVTATNGSIGPSSFPLAAGASVTIRTTAAVYAIAASGTPNAAVIES